MKIALVQMNPRIGDLAGNTSIILHYCEQASRRSADIIIFPELSLIGYPPKDLVNRNDFQCDQLLFLNEIAKKSPLPAIVGAAQMRDAYERPYNAAFMCHDDTVQVIAQKILLPNYNVFDELRHFSAPSHTACAMFSYKGHDILVSICEDAWGGADPITTKYRYDIDPLALAMSHKKPHVIVNISASPYTVHKPAIREQVFVNIAQRYETPVLMVGQVGANDQVIFDGGTMAIDARGVVVHRARACVEELHVINIKDLPKTFVPPMLDDDELLLEALTLGIADYVDKCQLPGLIIGLSGGIDSAVCAVLAVRAVGRDRVRVVYLPSDFSSESSFLDAQAQAHNLGLSLETIAIEEGVATLRKLLQPAIASAAHKPLALDIADQNLQSRMRGILLMALSNMSDFVMLATSNKSELAVGYATLYGDMCGAFSPLGDLYKTEIYRLVKTINKTSEIIPKNCIDKSPSAELKPNQKDSDNLPSYDELDQILYRYIDLEQSSSDIVQQASYKQELVNHVIKLVNLSDYKRRQGPFALMVSDKVFGDARRWPLAKYF